MSSTGSNDRCAGMRSTVPGRKLALSRVVVHGDESGRNDEALGVDGPFAGSLTDVADRYDLAGADGDIGQLTNGVRRSHRSRFLCTAAPVQPTGQPEPVPLLG